MNNTAKLLVRAIQNPTAEVELPPLKIASGDLSVSDPGIQIQGFGAMPFPMKTRHLKQIKPFAQQAPYGKGTRTVVDTSVRNTLEIEPEKLEISEDFQQSVREAIPEIAAELGVPDTELTAELYKLLIYEKGGRFDWHRDAEKQKGMVGSLIVVLPCRFGGGALTIRNPSSHKRYDFLQARLEQTAPYVAFYADAEHAVERVTSGVRVCLAYNLILKSNNSDRPILKFSGKGAAVTRAVNEWMNQNSGEPLVVALEHQYTENGLKPRFLKGVDREIADLLSLTAETLGCHFHLGMVSRHLCQFADDGSDDGSRYSYRDRRTRPVNYDTLDVGDVYEDDIEVDGWKDVEGAPAWLGTLPCQASSLVSLTPFEKWKPNSQDYEGYTGNAGNTLDRWVFQAIKKLGGDELIPHLKRLLEAEQPLDKYGRPDTSGLPIRDAHWLLKLCEKSDVLDVPSDVCAELVLLAVDRFATDARDRWEEYHYDVSANQETWCALVKVAITVEHQSKADWGGTRTLFDLLPELSPIFDLRKFQTGACVKLSNWSLKKFGQVAGPIQRWRDSVHDQLSVATASLPQPPADQTRGADVPCGCQYCAQLVEFLADSKKTTATIRARQDDRSHVERIIDQRLLDVATSTNRSGLPHGLVMTKTQASYERELKRYHEDLARISSL